jgi:transposase
MPRANRPASQSDGVCDR